MAEEKIPKKSKIKSKRLFVSPKSFVLKGRRVKVVDIGPLPETIRVEVDVPGQNIEGVGDKRTHDIISTHEAGRMIIIWENEEDLKRNKRVPLILHGDKLR